MNNQLTKQFPVFEANQILTHKHLNDLRAFLDEENRITRTHLSGTGIVCGLLVSRNLEASTITLKNGFGITSLGHLLEVPETLVLSYYRTYMEPVEEDNKYKFKESSIPTSTVYELFVSEPEEDEVIEENPVLPLSKIADISDYAVVVFLEHLQKDLRSCTGTNCDNKGKSSEYRIRVLLVDKDDLDAYESDSFLITVDNFPRLSIPRVRWNDLKNAVSAETLRSAYLKVMGDASFGVPAIVATIPQVWTRFALPLGIAFSEARVTEAASNLTGILSSADIQYSWDHLRVVCLAWNEFADVVCEMIGSCGLEIPYHPRHLVAGLLVPEAKTKTDRYRTTFIQRGPIDAEHKLLYRAQLLFERLVVLLESFRIPPKNNLPVYLTPSTSPAEVLSLQSIPFYYPFNGARTALLRLWNPLKTMKGRSHTQYCYWASSYDENTTVDDGFFPPQYARPFSFYPYPETFLRIEGLHGKERNVAINQLEKAKRDFNLNFRIETLYLTDDIETIQLDKINGCDHTTNGEEFLIRISAALNAYKKLTNYINTVATLFYKDKKPKQLEDFIGVINAMINFLQEVTSITSFKSSEFQRGYKKVQSAFVEMLAQFDLEFSLSSNFPAGSVEGELINIASALVTDLIELFAEEKLYTGIVRTWSTWFIHNERERYARAYTRQFSSFVSKNTGIEHFSGTWRGGTFYLVCVANPKSPELPSPETEEMVSAPSEVTMFRSSTVDDEPTVNSGYTVIADFTAPTCCVDFGCTNTIDEQLLIKILSNMNVILPFLPKDDLIFALTNQPVAIHPQLNDVNIYYKQPIRVEAYEESTVSNYDTKAGGKIRVIKGAGIQTHFEYTSPKDFVGLDSYVYTALTNDGKREDAIIWIRVRERKKPQFNFPSPYSVCWNENLEIEIPIDYNDYKEEDIIVTGNGVFFDTTRGRWYFSFANAKGRPTSISLNFAEKATPKVPLLPAPFVITIESIPGFSYTTPTWSKTSVGNVLMIPITDLSVNTTTINWFIEVENVRRQVSFVTDHLEIPIELLHSPTTVETDPLTFTFTIVQEVFGSMGCRNEHLSNAITVPNPDATTTASSASFAPLTLNLCQKDPVTAISYSTVPANARTSVYLSGAPGTSVYEDPAGSGNWFIDPNHSAIQSSPVLLNVLRRSDNFILNTIPLTINITPIVLFDRYTSKFGERTYVGLFDKTVDAAKTTWNIYKNKTLAFNIDNKAVAVQAFDKEALSSITFDLLIVGSTVCEGSRSSLASFKGISSLRTNSPGVFSENFVYTSAMLQRTLLFTTPLKELTTLNTIRTKSDTYMLNVRAYMQNPIGRDITSVNQLAAAAHSLLGSMDTTYAKGSAAIDAASGLNYADAIRMVFFNVIGLLFHCNQDISKTEVQGTIPPFTSGVPSTITPIGIMIQYWIERLFFKRDTTTLPLIDVTHDVDILTFWIDNASAKPELRDFLSKIRAQYISHTNNI